MGEAWPNTYNPQESTLSSEIHNTADGSGFRSNFFDAVCSDDGETVRFILDKDNLKVNVIDFKRGTSPLVEAAMRGYAGMTETLLDYKAEINQICNYNFLVPIQAAATSGQIETVAVLLRRGAIVDSRLTENCETAFTGSLDKALNAESTSVCERFLEVAKLLIDAQADVNCKVRGVGSLHRACLPAPYSWRIGSNKAIKFEISPEPLSFNQKRVRYMNAEAVVRLLLDSGADTNAKAFGLTPLQWANMDSGQSGNESVLQRLKSDANQPIVRLLKDVKRGRD
jgi:ankyrin repeat protein